MSADAISAEMTEHIVALGEGASTVKGAIRLAARLTGLPFGQVKRLRYGEWQVIPAHVADTVRAARRLKNERLSNAAKHEYEALETRIARLEALLQDPDANSSFRASRVRTDRDLDSPVG